MNTEVPTKKIIGEFIPKEDAIAQHDEFIAVHGENFPKAVCYRFDELIAFMEKANAEFEANGVPAEQRGVSLTFGIHLGERTHAKHRETVMMIATQYEEDDPTLGRVDRIQNPIVTDWYGGPTHGLVDACYDAASLWP